MIAALVFDAIIIVILLVYYFKNKIKAKEALMIARNTFNSIFPLLLILLLLISFFKGILSVDTIRVYVSSLHGFAGYIISAIAGSLFHVPSFIAFPIGGQLLQNGVKVGIVCVFITSLIMVHIFTIPIEIKELGYKFAILRNLLSIIAAILIGAIMGVIY
ncbi:MAG: permease [Candidatus Woesearchaeota archaeon]